MSAETITAATTYTAQWKTITYNIIYDLNDNASTPATNHEDNVSTYNVESDAITLKAPTRQGFRFTGWKYNGDITMAPVIASGTTGNRTYLA